MTNIVFYALIFSIFTRRYEENNYYITLVTWGANVNFDLFIWILFTSGYTDPRGEFPKLTGYQNETAFQYNMRKEKDILNTVQLDGLEYF